MRIAVNRRPTHPGELLRQDILPGTKLTQARLAELLELSRKTVNEILLAKSPVTPETATKLGRIFKNSPQFWMNMQTRFDLWNVQLEPEWVKRLELYRRELSRG